MTTSPLTVVVETPEQLRDHFERLGTPARVVSGNAVEVELPDGEDGGETVLECVRQWSAATGIAVFIPLPAPAPAPRAPAPPAASPFFLDRPRLGDLLLKKGLISPEQLEVALEASRTGGELLGRVLIGRGFIFEDELARTLAAQLDIPYVNLRVAGYDRSVARLMPSAEGLRVAAIPIGIRGGRIRVVFADPTDEAARELVRRYAGDFELAVADLSDIELAWRTVDPAVA